MNLEPDLVPPALLWIALLALLTLAARCARTASWRTLLDNNLGPLLVTGAACCGGLWSMSVGVQPGLELHLLGTTSLTLVFGWRFALIAAVGGLLGVTALGAYHWEVLGLNGLLLAALPVAVTHWIGRIVYRYLPHHLFIYLFLTAFLGGMLSIAASILASAGLLLMVGPHDLDTVLRDYLALMPLMMFPEGFINGMVMTMLVVFRPELVRTFDERDYLDDR